MKSVFIDNNLDEILLDYYDYLLNNDIDNYRSIDYVFDLINKLELSNKYLKSFSFDSNLNSNGIYIPNEQKVIVNPFKIIACYELGYYDKSQTILSYFNLLIHEITHVYQKFYKDNYDDEVSTVLKESEKLKFLSNNDSNLYSLFPDEVNANMNSSIYLYKLASSNNLCDFNYLDKVLIYFLSLGIIDDKRVINSQIKYLYKKILGIKYEEEFYLLDNVDSLYLGLTKDKDTMKQLVKSYQTQKLCLDIKF